MCNRRCCHMGFIAFCSIVFIHLSLATGLKFEKWSAISLRFKEQWRWKKESRSKKVSFRCILVIIINFSFLFIFNFYFGDFCFFFSYEKKERSTLWIAAQGSIFILCTHIFIFFFIIINISHFQGTWDQYACTGVKGISKMRRIRKKKYIKIIWNDLPGRNAKAFANVVLSAKTNKIKKRFRKSLCFGWNICRHSMSNNIYKWDILWNNRRQNKTNQWTLKWTVWFVVNFKIS